MLCISACIYCKLCFVIKSVPAVVVVVTLPPEAKNKEEYTNKPPLLRSVSVCCFFPL